jgi:methyl-accepting chemotaxis protein
MTIKHSLLAIICVLALVIASFNGIGFYKAWQEKKAFDFTQKTSATIELLLNSAGNWAVERGVTNAGLKATGMPSEKMLGTIKARREAGNATFQQAIVQLEGYDFNNKQTLLPALKGAFENAQQKRALADKALVMPRSERDAALLGKWVPTMSGLIVLSQDVRFSLTQKTASLDPELGRQAQLKHFSWMMSEFAGRERAILGGTLSGGAMIDSKKYGTLSRYRGNVETGWDIVQKLSVGSGAQVLASIEQTSELFFGPFQQTRLAIYAAGVAQKAYPMTAQEWIDRSTGAINTILATQEASVAETHAYLTDGQASIMGKLLLNGGIFIFSLCIVGLAFYVVILRVTGPIDRMTDVMGQLAGGNTDVNIEGVARGDEVGKMARAVEVFKESAIERIRLREEQKQAQLHAEEDKKRAMRDLADKFEGRVKSVIQTVASASTQLTQTAQSLTDMMTQSSQLTNQAVLGAKETTQNVHSVASAAEEMSATVNEISSQIRKSNELIVLSVEQVDGADQYAQALASAGQQVKNVTQLISGIARQTNLLALNATIEAARAGEAGKGFAVVAGEVKLLADQTDKSIQEIDSVIHEMSKASDNIVASLGGIKSSVSQISDASGGVAAAVDEQTSATQEIAQSMQSAAQSTGDISNNLDGVNESAIQSQAASEQVYCAAQELSRQSELLDKEVRAFLDDIRTG